MREIKIISNSRFKCVHGRLISSSSKKNVLTGVAVTTNVYKLASMVRAFNTGWECNVLRNIDPCFIVHYFVHGGNSCNFASQF